jgi:hypothetical protein
MSESNLNPRDIPEQDLPLIVLSDHTNGLIQSIIKIKTKGFYNHAMWMHKPGMFASQGNTYSEIPVESYMRRGNRLKFIRIRGLNVLNKDQIRRSIKAKINRPWYKKTYDWLGILGQAIGLKKISTPGLDYCSEDVPRHLRCIAPIDSNPLKSFIKDLPRHGSPEDLNEHFKKHKDVTQVYGRWDSDKV